MSTLSSSSTLADYITAYKENLSYRSGGGSVSKAETFIEACEGLLLLRPKSVEHAGEKVELTPEHLQEAIKRAEQWIASNPSASSGAGAVRHYDFQDLRS